MGQLGFDGCSEGVDIEGFVAIFASNLPTISATVPLRTSCPRPVAIETAFAIPFRPTSLPPTDTFLCPYIVVASGLIRATAAKPVLRAGSSHGVASAGAVVALEHRNGLTPPGVSCTESGFFVPNNSTGAASQGALIAVPSRLNLSH